MKKVFALLAILMMAVTGAKAQTTVTFAKGESSKSGITWSGFSFNNDNLTSFGTVTSTVGNITSIVVNSDPDYDMFNGNISGSGWSGKTWTGSSTSVSGSMGGTKIYEFISMVVTIEAANVDVTGVTLSQTSAAMTVGGETLTLTATVAPDDATDKTVTWATSDAAVATVADGVVTAVGAGTATITVTATNGTDGDTSDDQTATCTVTVSPATYTVTVKDGTEDATNWTITPSTATAGETVTVTYSGTKKVKSVKAKKK